MNKRVFSALQVSTKPRKQKKPGFAGILYKSKSRTTLEGSYLFCLNCVYQLFELRVWLLRGGIVHADTDKEGPSATKPHHCLNTLPPTACHPFTSGGAWGSRGVAGSQIALDVGCSGVRWGERCLLITAKELKKHGPRKLSQRRASPQTPIHTPNGKNKKNLKLVWGVDAESQDKEGRP